MVYIDRLLKVEDEYAMCETRLSPGHMLLDDEGRMDRVGFVELAAQGYAAVQGFEFASKGLPFPVGYLVGVQAFECFGDAYENDLLHIETKTVGTFEGFGVVQATIRHGNSVLAQGKIKLYVPNAEELEMEAER